MRLNKIEIKYEIHRRAEKLMLWFVWKLPRKLVMWSYIRVAAHATTGQFGNTVVPEITMMDALQRWDQPNTPDLPVLLGRPTA
jgi:hypothetical protein